MVTASENRGIQDFIQFSDGAKGEALLCDAKPLRNLFAHQEPAQEFVKMDGQEVFKFAVRRVSESIDQLLERNGLTAGDIGGSNRMHVPQGKRINTLSMLERHGIISKDITPYTRPQYPCKPDRLPKTNFLPYHINASPGQPVRQGRCPPFGRTANRRKYNIF